MPVDDFGIDFNGGDVKGRVVGNEVFGSEKPPPLR